MENFITVNSRKIDGKIYKSWSAELIGQKNSLLTLIGAFDEEISHPHLGVIKRGTISYEFYWLDRWYNIFRFHEPNGNLRNFYCNVNLPPVFGEKVLDYIDLDIDVVVWKDYSFEVLDLDEFRENSLKFDYTMEIYDKALKSLDALISMIKNRAFPFNDF